MKEKITSHALLRYMERVLRLPVNDWLSGKDELAENIKVEVCCRRSGITLADLQTSMLNPVVQLVLKAGFKDCRVRADTVIYVIRDGVLITVMQDATLRPRRPARLKKELWP